MPLPQGTRLGPYELIAHIGAGGMGEVYKAKDLRLDRLVAVKVLPEHLAQSADALARFEREAKAVAALNHPSLTGLFDLGQEGGIAFVVMELLEGESLRARLTQGPLPPRRATDLAIQMARGLAAAHDKGVIHRDLKPENLWLTRDGRLKILDFGLAKQVAVAGKGSGSFLATEGVSPGHLTEQGMILGTLGYMSPEQVRGEGVDARADLFSFGAVLFEMVTGKRAFARETASDTMAAILRDEPPELEGSGRTVPMGLRRIIDHCLEKAPEARFRDAHDLAFALENLANASASNAPLTAPFAPQNRKATRTWAALAAVLVLGAFAAGWGLHGGGGAKPTFKRLTYGKGTLGRARFVPGSKEIVFSASLNGSSSELFSLNPDALEPRSLGVQGSLLAVAPSGELAVSLRTRLWAGFDMGQLARVAPGGGTRLLHDEVMDADWMPDGTRLAMAYSDAKPVEGANAPVWRMVTLEFPPGHPLQEGAQFTWALRMAPDGKRLACFEQDTFNHGDGKVVVVDLTGHRATWGESRGFTGLAWGPGGALWFSEFQDGTSSLWRLQAGGDKRLLMRQAGLLEIMDVAQDGRALASVGQVITGTMGMSAPAFREKDLSWNEATFTHDISPDGSRLLLGPGGGWVSEGERLSVYLRQADGANPTLLGEGTSASFMPNGKQVLLLSGMRDSRLTLVPLASGSPQELSLPGLKTPSCEPMPDGHHVLVAGATSLTEQLLDLDTGARLNVGERYMSGTAGARSISPDGRWVILRKHTGRNLDDPLVLASTSSAELRPVKGIEPGDLPMRWNADGSAIFVFNRDGLPARIHSLDQATGKRTLVREIMPANASGLTGIRSFAMTPDAQHLAYNYVRKLSVLYLIEGLR